MAENRKSLLPWILIWGGTLLLFAGFAWILMNKQAAPVVTPTPASVEQVERVSLDDSKAAFDSGKAVFLDVRSSSSYEESHIPGAVLIPSNEISNRLGELDPSSWIIPYCT